MSIYATNQFWNYITAEPETIINRCIEILTLKKYNFDTKQYDTSEFYQIISDLTIDSERYITLRYPAGLTTYLRNKLPLPIETKYDPEYSKYSSLDVLDKAKELRKFNPKLEIRDYQLKAVQASLKNFQSLISATVGSGKTTIMSIVCEMLENDNILILNDNNFILQQIYDRLISLGEENISWNPSKEPDYTKRIVILNTASSNSRLVRNNQDYINYLKTVNAIIWDECQSVQALTWHEPIFYTDPDKLKRIIGYSGSPFRNYKFPYNDIQDTITIAILGEPAFRYEMKDTIADGNIAQPYSYFINFKNKPAYIPERFKDNYFMQYKMNITYNKARNKAGLEMLKFLNKHGIKTLASYNNLKPAQAMMKEIAELGIKTLFICGDNTIYEWKPGKRGALKLEEREGDISDVKKALNDGYNIIFGSKVMDRGIDVEQFQAVVLFSGSRTPIANIQRIGRCSRKKSTGQNISFVIDFKDINGCPIFRDHYEQRKALMLDSGVKNIERVQDFMDLIEQVSNDKI